MYFERIGLILKSDHDGIIEVARKSATTLKNCCARVYIIENDTFGKGANLDLEYLNVKQINDNCDLIIVIGGDGSFLAAARALAGTDIPILGINLGRLGFMADILPEDVETQLPAILHGEFKEDARSTLDGTLVRDGEMISHQTALNEFVIHKHNIARLIELETHIDGKLLNRHRSDGLIISTPTGSTAYALSGGGPILHPGLPAHVLVPICPHTLSNRPIVIDCNAEICVKLLESGENGALLTADGQQSHPLMTGDKLSIKKSTNHVRLIHPTEHNHFATLRAKLHWSREL